MRVMLYIRPKALKFFIDLANDVFQKPYIVTFSDFYGIADNWAGKYIYNNKYDFKNYDYEKIKYDILPRCRTLRKMPMHIADKIARRYWNGMEEFFSNNKFDYVFMLPVDCYSLDIIDRVAKKYGVHVISFIGSPFANLAKLTVRGEYLKVRDNVPEEEIQNLIDKFTKKDYLSPSEVKNVKKNHNSIYKFYFRRFLIEKFYYPILKYIDNDPLNYHYNIIEVKDKKFNDVFDRDFESRFKHIYDITFDPKRTVYYPMHLVPEATTDYWCEDVGASNYDQYVLNMIINADNGIKFIIKEHPAMYGRRLLSFYDQLNSMPNVILLHPMDRSNNLLDLVENVVVDNGTVGIEALIRGKRVLCISNNYYQKFHPNAFRVDRISYNYLDIPLTNWPNYKFMKSILQGCFPSDFKNSRNGIPNSNYKAVAEGIKKYLKLNNLNSFLYNSKCRE